MRDTHTGSEILTKNADLSHAMPPFALPMLRRRPLLVHGQTAVGQSTVHLLGQVVACGRIPILPTRVISVLGLKSTLENPQIQVYFAGNGLLAGENGWPFRRFCGGGGGLPAPLLAPRALILRTKQRLDRASRPTPPYFGHA